MTDKFGNGQSGEGGDGGGDEEDIPVEVDAFDQTTRPVIIPDLKHRRDWAPPDDDADADVVPPIPAGPSFEQRCAELEVEKKEVYDRLLRTAADLENLRKRSRRDLDDARLDARQRVLKEMLPVIDNLERAVAHAERPGGEAADGATAPVIEGIQLVLRQFGQALERCEVTLVEAEGQPFDPALHEAISQVDSADAPAGTVVSVLQRGYRIGNRLLRPALVVVARAPAAAGAGGDGHGAAGGGDADGEVEGREA